MSVYHICPNCGAYLDPGERCDCQDKKEDAAPVLQHQSGKVDPKFSPGSASIVPNTKEEIKYV